MFFLTGMLIMAWNVWKTVRLGKPYDALDSGIQSVPRMQCRPIPVPAAVAHGA